MISRERAQELLAAFSGKKLLIVGDVFLDKYVIGIVERLNPEAPVPILHAKREENATGGAGNAAKSAAMIGAETTCIGIIGHDDAGSILEETAKKENYNPIFVHQDRVPTIVKKRYIVGSQQLLRVDHEEVLDMDAASEASIIAAIEQQVGHVDGIIVSDYAKGAITQSVAEVLLKHMKERNIPMMADIKPSRVSYFTGATYMSPNKKEAHEFLGLPLGKPAYELAQMVSTSFDTSVFLTLSGEGMYVQEKGEEGVYVPTSYISHDEVIDTSGCGDTAAVVILLAKIAGATGAEAAELGNAAGAAVARKTGAVGITQEELIKTLA